MKKLITMQYTRNEVDFKRGTFRAKGDILEIYPSSQSESSIRIEFWGDTIDSIRYFDVESQRSLEEINECEIRPYSEFINEKIISTIWTVICIDSDSCRMQASFH